MTQAKPILLIDNDRDDTYEPEYVKSFLEKITRVRVRRPHVAALRRIPNQEKIVEMGKELCKEGIDTDRVDLVALGRGMGILYSFHMVGNKVAIDVDEYDIVRIEDVDLGDVRRIYFWESVGAGLAWKNQQGTHCNRIVITESPVHLEDTKPIQVSCREEASEYARLFSSICRGGVRPDACVKYVTEGMDTGTAFADADRLFRSPTSPVFSLSHSTIKFRK